MVDVQISDILLGLGGKMPDLTVKQNTKPEYRPHKTPPDFQMAINHGNAKKVYKVVNYDALEEADKENVCPCCGVLIDREELPLRCKLSDLYHLGCGFALYFKFLLWCAALLGIILVISGLYGIFSNLFGQDCAQNEDGSLLEYCTETMILTFSLANKRNSPAEIKAQLVLNFVAIVFVIAYLQYIRYHTRRIAVDAEDRTVTPSDFTLQLKRVNATTTDEELRTWLEGMGTETNSVKVAKIVRSYDIREYVVLQKRKELLKDERETATDPEQLRIIDDELESVKQKLGRYKKGGLQYAEAVYVTFEQAQQADFIRKKFMKSPAKKAFDFLIAPFHSTFDRLNGKAVKVKRAPEPTGILWENIGYTSKEKFKKRIITNSSAVLLILVSFVLITIVCWAQIHAPDMLGEHKNIIRLLSLIGSLFIYVINTMLSMTIRWLADFEKHSTYTGYYTGLSWKLCLAMFVNTAFTTLFAKVALASEFAETTGISNYLKAVNFYNTGGLLENICYVVITGALLSPFLVIFDPWFIFKKFQQKMELSKGEKSTKTQEDAHTLFEGTNFDLSYKYALLVKGMLFAAFYAPALPTVLVITLIGIALTYWTDKYVLLRRIALPFSIDDDLTRVMTELMEWMPFAFAAGNMMFTLILQTSDEEVPYDAAGFGLMWATMILSLVNIVLPMDYINEKLFPISDEVTETYTYEKARLSFGTDYDIQNPITRKRALKEYLELSKHKGESGGGLLLKGLARDILSLAQMPKTEGEPDQADLTFLDEYAEQVKEKPFKEAEANNNQFREALEEHGIDHGAFMHQLGSMLGKAGKIGGEAAEGENEWTGLLKK